MVYDEYRVRVQHRERLVFTVLWVPCRGTVNRKYGSIGWQASVLNNASAHRHICIDKDDGCILDANRRTAKQHNVQFSCDGNGSSFARWSGDADDAVYNDWTKENKSPTYTTKMGEKKRSRFTCGTHRTYFAPNSVLYFLHLTSLNQNSQCLCCIYSP